MIMAEARESVRAMRLFMACPSSGAGCATFAERQRFAATIDMAGRRLVSLGVWFPPTKLNTLGTTPEVVVHHLSRARVHRIVSKKPAHRIERAIYVIDTIINPNPVAILDPIFGHGLSAALD
jgi:hypothetical protein